MRQRAQQADRMAQLMAEQEDQYLETAEQEELVALLAQQHAMSSRRWRLTFAVIIAAAALAMLYFAAQQAVNPWGMKHHAAFYGAMPPMLLAAAEALAGLCLAAEVLHLGGGWPGAGKTGSRGTVVGQVAGRVALGSALLMAVIWGGILQQAVQRGKMGRREAIDNLWLPLVPLLLVLLSRFVVHTLSGTEGELDKLRGQMYAFKKL